MINPKDIRQVTFSKVSLFKDYGVLVFYLNNYEQSIHVYIHNDTEANVFLVWLSIARTPFISRQGPIVFEGWNYPSAI